ncbi:hypothetical protein EP7_000633 [Isosphaeraceae bacterium EP7]
MADAPARPPFRDFRRPLAGLALAATLALPGAARVMADEPAEWIAGDAVAFVELRRPGDLIDRARDPRTAAVVGSIPDLARQLKSPQVRDLRALVAFLSATLDTTWDEGLRDLAGGGAVLALEAPDGKPRVALIITPRDAKFLDRAHATLLELARKDASEKGKPDPVAEIKHREIVGFSLSPQEAHAIVGGRLVVANGPEALKSLIDRSLDHPRGSLAEDKTWSARKKATPGDALAWGLVRLDKLRAIDPAKFKIPENVEPGPVILFGAWLDALRKADWLGASLNWTEKALSASVDLPTPAGGYPAPIARFLPGKGQGAPGLVRPPGTVASLSLWRDLSGLWDVREQLLPPEAVAGLAALDTPAGQFLGGRDFAELLGALKADWRLVVATQDTAKLKRMPDLKLPAFALVADLKPEDEDLPTQLKVAFQSFIGLLNLDAAQSKSPPLDLGSETVDGFVIATSKYIAPRAKAGAAPAGPVSTRYNFSPSMVQVGDHLVISSTLGLARDLVAQLKQPLKAEDATLAIEADGAALANLVALNRERMISNNMLEKGNDRDKAKTEIALLETLLRLLGKGRLTAVDTPDEVHFQARFNLGEATK